MVDVRDPEAQADIEAAQALINELPPDGQRRVAVVAQILRDLLVADGKHEVELAFTLVMAELSHG